ncbi:MAG: hypothetical protein A3F68_08905 [Acidobacteria bacterium RIFCSPLOWO2_12_FULL_54_10]|nr:MAG: hypothetical protein A3F68_08905 [Acidobacteria bacterium RIFCSPLOWO2_12_FULL_54_10]OFW12038.1 MAG: hypothetical protein A3H27_11670 [Acidobacteria bacterium RIFCSPLOWO2_02_FULL_59_13]
MNWDQLEGNWKQFKGEVRERWGRFTEDDVDVIKGRREQLVGRLQEKYGILREEAEREIAEFLVSLDEPPRVETHM